MRVSALEEGIKGKNDGDRNTVVGVAVPNKPVRKSFPLRFNRIFPVHCSEETRVGQAWI